MARFQQIFHDSVIDRPKTNQFYCPRYANQPVQNNSLLSYDPYNRIRYLSNICNELISSRDSQNSALKYAKSVVFSILDNANIDLCLILPRYDKEHEDLTHKVGCLLGYDSTTFKLIFSDESLFDYFLDNFTRHAELSTATFTSASSSLYIWLLRGYLQRLLPISDIELASIQASTLFKQSPKRPARKSSRTPFQLLREDLFFNMADTFEETFEFDHSSYARLFQFVELLISSYSSTAITPSPSQIVALKNVIDVYTEFLLAPTLDKDLESFKSRLQSNRQFSHLMSGYLKNMFSNLALNEGFIYHVEMLITLICPTQAVFANPDKLNLFKRCFAAHFVNLLDVLLERLSNADIRTLIQLDLLQHYLVVLFNSNFIRMLCDMHISAIKYIKPIQRRLNSVVEKNLNSSTFARFTSFMSEMLDNGDERDVKTYLAIINDRLKSPYVTYPPSDPDERSVEDISFVDVSNVTAGQMNSTLTRKVRTGIPDHYQDSFNFLYYLTPKGIEQVKNRQARFDFSQHAKTIYASKGNVIWENKWLAEKLNRIALGLVNHPFVRHLRRVSNNPAVGPVIRPLMIPRSPPRDVPIYAKNIPRHLETINLRIFASYPLLLVILYLIWKFVSFLSSLLF